MVSGRQAHRLHRLVWPELKGQRGAGAPVQGVQGSRESGYVTSEAQYRYWDHHVPMGPRRAAARPRRPDRPGAQPVRGSRLRADAGQPDAISFDISPDGRSICFAFDPQPRKQLDHCMALAEFDVPSGRVETVAVDPAWDFSAPRYGPDGRYIAFIASHQGRSTPCPATWRCCGARASAGPWLAGAEHGLGPLGQCAAALGRGWRRDLLRRRGPRPLPPVAHGRREPRARGRGRGGWVQAFDVAGDVVATVADASDHPPRARTPAAATRRRSGSRPSTTRCSSPSPSARPRK